MAITVTCKCGNSYQVKDQFAGHETNCPYCGKLLTIPSIEKAKEIDTSPPSVVESRSLEKEEMVEPPVFQDIQPETLSSVEQDAMSTRAEPQRPVEPSVPERQQAKFAASEDKEICANCGRQIHRSEQACIFNGKIVCAECDKKLRKACEADQASVLAEELQDVLDKLPEAGQSKKSRKISIGGFIVALILIALAFLISFQDQIFQYDTPERTPIHQIPAQRTRHEQIAQTSGEALDWLLLFLWFGPGVAIMVRSCYPSLGLFRGFCTFLGGIVLAFGLILTGSLFVMLSQLGKPGSPSSAIIVIIMMMLPSMVLFALAVILFKLGFKPEKGSS